MCQGSDSEKIEAVPPVHAAVASSARVTFPSRVPEIFDNVREWNVASRVMGHKTVTPAAVKLIADQATR